ETSRPSTQHGGHAAAAGRVHRDLAWTRDPHHEYTTYLVDYAFLPREADGTVRVAHDRHVEGLFARADWLRVLAGAGFEPTVVPFTHPEIDRPLDVFVGRRPGP